MIIGTPSAHQSFGVRSDSEDVDKGELITIEICGGRCLVNIVHASLRETVSSALVRLV